MMIHWHEGLHLLPQHLQMLQRLFGEALAVQRGSVHRFRGGSFELGLTLAKGTVAVRSLKALMPSGIFLDYPHNVDIPARDISGALAAQVRPGSREATKGVNLHLAIPHWNPHTGNAFRLGEAADTRLKLRYLLHEEEHPDENEGGEARPICLRKYNGRLMLDSEDAAGMEKLFLGRIVQTPSGAEVEWHRETCPPILRIGAWRPLKELVEELVNALDHARGSLTGRILEGGFSTESLHGNQLGLLLRLRTVNHFLPRLKAMVAVEETPPFEVFCEMLGLCGELVALAPAKESLELTEYNHEGPYEQFKTLNDKIRRNLEAIPDVQVTRIPFESVDDRTWKAILPDDLVTDEKTVHLQVNAVGDQQLVHDMRNRCGFVIAPFSRLWKKRVTEIEFDPVTAPMGYPAQLQYKYFVVRKLASHLARTGAAGTQKEAELGVSWIEDAGISFKGFTLFIQ